MSDFVGNATRKSRSLTIFSMSLQIVACGSDKIFDNLETSKTIIKDYSSLQHVRRNSTISFLEVGIPQNTMSGQQCFIVFCTVQFALLQCHNGTAVLAFWHSIAMEIHAIWMLTWHDATWCHAIKSSCRNLLAYGMLAGTVNIKAMTMYLSDMKRG